MSATLGRTAVRGGTWVVGLRVFHQVLQVLKLVVLARLLAPSHFGLVSIALLVTTVLQVFTETGFENALIQRDDDVRPYLNGAWTMLVLRGLLIGLVLVVAAPLAAMFFRAPGADGIVRGMAVAVVLDGLLNIGTVFFKKELDFRRYAAVESIGYAADFVVSVAAAIILRNAWALVIGRIMASALRTGSSYFISSYRPRFDFNIERARELFGFGKWMLGSSVLVFAITQGDNAVVGRLLGATALGLYTMAYRFSCLPATEITSMVSNITFPVYSKLQNDRDRLGTAYGRVLNVLALLAFVLAAGVFALSYDAVNIFMGAKWLPMISAIWVLVWFGVARGLAGAMTPLFMSIGKPRLVATQQFWQAVLMYALMFPLTLRYGIVGTASAVLISAATMFLARVGQVSKILGWRQWEYYKRLLLPTIASAGSIAATYGVRLLAPGGEVGLVWLLLMGVVFCVAFGGVVLLGDRVMGLGILKTVLDVVGQVVRRKESVPDAVEQIEAAEPVLKAGEELGTGPAAEVTR